MQSDILRYPADALKALCDDLDPLTHESRSLAERLRAEMKGARRQAIGIAAPQIGVTKRCFLLDKKHLKLSCSDVFVNPIVVSESTLRATASEGCLSFPDSVGVAVSRPITATIMAFDIYGELFTVALHDLAARCALHEMDHLNGITIMDHATKGEKKKILKAIVVDAKRGSRR